MREKTVTFKLYRFDELSDDAKEKALADYNRCSEYPWAYEIRATLKAFEDAVGITVNNWSYSSYTHDSGVINWGSWDDACLELRGERARSYLWNNFGHKIFKARTVWSSHCTSIHSKSRKSRMSVSCDCPFTGVCFDMVVLDPVLKYMTCQDRREDRTVQEIIEECVETLFLAAENDCRECESMEHFADLCLGNNWEFREDGTIE